MLIFLILQRRFLLFNQLKRKSEHLLVYARVCQHAGVFDSVPVYRLVAVRQPVRGRVPENLQCPAYRLSGVSSPVYRFSPRFRLDFASQLYYAATRIFCQQVFQKNVATRIFL